MDIPLPLVEPLLGVSPEEAFRRLADWPHCVFLDSAMAHPALGRFSFVAADPFAWIERSADGNDALKALAEAMAPYRAETLPDLPPFQGGAAGLFGYELRHSLERLPETKCNELQMPALAVGLYDVVVAFDRQQGQAWIISQGWPAQSPEDRLARAQQRLAQFRQQLRPPEGDRSMFSDSVLRLPQTAAAEKWTSPRTRHPSRPEGDRSMFSDSVLRPSQTAAAEKWTSPLASNFSRNAYLAAVQRVIDYITAGDVFQVNLSQQLVCPASEDGVSLYLRLRQTSPAPFAGYFDLGDRQILSASPERFLRVLGRDVETRPIKGTCRRRGNASDVEAQRELLASEKDRAENIMIVDLLRNDLSRVCQADSVQVSQLCAIEAYEHVFHLVSAVEGRLRDGLGPLDLLRACFPGGSVTGAPKIRAMEIIAELEPNARGAYCGALGYVGFDGNMDTSILIRTITAAAGRWHFAVGGGVVAQSSPEREYEETWEKAEGMLRAVCAGDDLASRGR